MSNGISRPTGFWTSAAMRLVLGIALVLGAVVAAQLFITSLPVSKLWQNILLGIFTPPVAVGAYYVLVHFFERRNLAELARKYAVRELTLGIVMGVLLFCAVMAILTLSGSLQIHGTNGWSVMLVPFVGALTSAVFEEILFRGVLYRIVEEGLGSWLALLISGVIFGGLHLLNPNATWMGAMAVFLTAGVLLAACFMVTRRLWLPIGVHFAWNFTQSAVFGLAVSGNAARPGLLQSSLAGPNWLTGGEFGPEASVVTVILGLALGAVLIWRAALKGNLVPVPWARKRA